MIYAAYFNKTSILALLVSLPILLLPGHRYEIGTLILLFFSLHILFTKRRLELNQNALLVWSMLFSAIWIPSLASLPDAINFSHSATNAFGQLRFYIAGIAIIFILSNSNVWPIFFSFLGIGLSFVFFDNIVQLLTGTDIFGLPTYVGRLNAPWTSDGPKMGIFIALLAPIIVGYFFDRKPLVAWALSAMAIFLILMSGQRGAWLALSTSLLIYMATFGKDLKRHLPFIFKLSTALALSLLIAYSTFPPFKERADFTLVVLNFDDASLQKSTGRLEIWKAAAKVIEENPLNGVGIRGFRYAESTGERPRNHVHSTTIEIFTEAGLIGIIGYIFFFWILFRKLLKSTVDRLTHLQRFTLGSVVAAASPLSMSLAFYSSNKATIFWYITALLVSFFFVKASDKDLELKKSS